MLHRLAIRHFDPDDIAARRLVVRRPLEMAVVTHLLKELGEADASGRVTLGGQPVEFSTGYIVCPRLTPNRNVVTEAFATRLHREVACDLYDTGQRAVVLPEDLTGP